MKLLALAAALALTAHPAQGQTQLASREGGTPGTTSLEARPTIVLVHGAFVDGSGWEGVYKILRKEGDRVSIVQNPTTSLATDVAFTRRAIDAAGGPVILVGHSYGGVVITEAGNDPRVAGLVYVAAFAPDNGESVAKLLANPAPGSPAPPILPPQDGFLALDRGKFRAAFAGDVNEPLVDFMAASQVPWGVDALNGEVTQAAWKTKPTWYIVAKDDHTIPPDLQRFMSRRAGAMVAESSGSHALYISRAPTVAALINRAAASLAMPSTK